MVYVFDGTEQGFYTAFLAAYHDEYALLSSRQLQLPLGYEPKFGLQSVPDAPMRW
jgi:hypothetical protein